jgi:hypothetical protein
VTGSIALPNDSSLIRGIAPLPVEFRNLCKWAPRTPTEGAQAPYTALELFEVSKKWNDAVHNQKPYTPLPQAPKWSGLVWTVVLLSLAALFVFLGFPGLSGIFPNSSATSTLTSTQLTLIVSSEIPMFTETQTAIATSTETPTIPAKLTSTASFTPMPVISPSPGTFAPILVFDNNLAVDAINPCWDSTTNLPTGLKRFEGFSRRDVDRYWRFGVDKDRTTEDIIQTDFKKCLNDGPISAIGMDVSILRLEANREFGFFLEDENGKRREYTLRLENVDNVDRMYLRIRDNNNIADYEQLFINNLIADRRSYLHPYYQFSLQIFFEVNNQGLDIIYLREGKLKVPVQVEDIDLKFKRSGFLVMVAKHKSLSGRWHFLESNLTGTKDNQS